MAPLGRREFIKLIGAAAAMAGLPIGCGTRAGVFFSDDERKTLAALADAILPPDDLPGGAALGAVEYIERLLTVFDEELPPIFAGGPYSGRAPLPDGTGAVNQFADFLPIDRVSLAAWRLEIYGSAAVEGGGPNDSVSSDQVRGAGPIVGLRERVRGILDRAHGAASLDAAGLAALIDNMDADDRRDLAQLVSEAAFAAPEYGGNIGLAGWKLTHFEGDSQPLGYSVFEAGQYRERPEAPMSTANPGADPEPMDAEVRALIEKIVAAAGGKVFP